MKLRILSMLCAALVGWLGRTASAAEKAALVPEVLHAGFTTHAFFGLNRADAESAFKVFSRTVGVRRGYSLEVTVTVFEKKEQVEAALASGAVNLFILDSWTYLGLADPASIDACYLPSDSQNPAKRQLLLTRCGSGLDRLEQLRGRSMALLATPNSTIAFPWLEALLGDGALGAPRTFFSSLESFPKPSGVVLPVFFGKRDACVVDSTGFDLMTELNPQVGSNLQVIATSEPLVNGIIGLSRAGWNSATFRQHLREALGELHEEPAGQQVLTLFRSSRLVPFDDGLLETARRLRATHLEHRLEPRP